MWSAVFWWKIQETNEGIALLTYLLMPYLILKVIKKKKKKEKKRQKKEVPRKVSWICEIMSQHKRTYMVQILFKGGLSFSKVILPSDLY